MHYKRVWKHGDASHGRKQRQICSVDGCCRVVKGGGLCSAHWQRFRRNGDIISPKSGSVLIKKYSGMTTRNKKEYGIYKGMMQRCYNRDNAQYANYGGRGISVCEEWRTTGGFARFLDDMGECPPRMSLDRIDVNGSYCPENCRWASSKTQQNNRRINILITRNGETLSLKQWCERLGINYPKTWWRYKHGWNESDLFS